MHPPKDTDPFTPTHAFYIRRHTNWSKTIKVIDLTPEILPSYSGGPIPDSLRDTARHLADSPSRADNPTYLFTRRHVLRICSDIIMTDPNSRLLHKAEIATWTEPRNRYRSVPVRFPQHSEHMEDFVMPAPQHWMGRTASWWQAKYKYEWRYDSILASNRMTLIKWVGKEEKIVARYVQRWGGFVAGGLVLVDGGLLDEKMVVLTAVVMLWRMMSRAVELSFGDITWFDTEVTIVDGSGINAIAGMAGGAGGA